MLVEYKSWQGYYTRRIQIMARVLCYYNTNNDNVTVQVQYKLWQGYCASTIQIMTSLMCKYNTNHGKATVLVQ